MSSSSIQSRFLWAILLLLPLFLGMMAIALDNAHIKSLLNAEDEKLQLNVLNTISQLDVLPGSSQPLDSSPQAKTQYSLRMPEQLQDASFNRPSSGFYAYIVNPSGNFLWQSPSTLTLATEVLTAQGIAPGTPGQYQFQPELVPDFFAMTYDVIWELGTNEIPLQIIILKSKQAYSDTLGQYRQTLTLSLTTITLLLCALLFFIVRWGLAPLARLSIQVKELESGTRDSLDEQHPKELAPLVHNLQALIKTERHQRQRYRDTLADLAHSLKTPLSIVRGLSTTEPETQAVLQEQVTQMNQIVEYQLQRAVSASSHRLMHKINAAPVIQRILNVLQKVYADKQIDCQVGRLSSALFIGDERDLMEVLGNLLDNAFKYTKSIVAVSSMITNQGDTNQGDTNQNSQPSQTIAISIEDDGAGVPENYRKEILRRGQRADTQQPGQQQPGQGIGLAVAMDIIASYHGKLEVDQSTLGGARFIVTLPGQASSTSS